MQATIGTPKRWDKLLPIILPMLFLALVGVALLPTHPSLGAFLHVALLACIIGLILARHTSDIWRRLPGYDDIEYDEHGKPIQGKRPGFHGALLQACILWTAFAEVNLLQTTFNNEYSYTIGPMIWLLALSVMQLGMITVLGPTRIQTLERALYGRGKIIKRIAALSVYVGFVSIAFFVVFQMFGNVTSGPAAPWEKLLSFAQDQAHGIDNAAVLYDVQARPVYSAAHPYGPQNTPLEVDFEFLRPSGNSIRITMLDVDPPRLVAIKNPGYSGGAPITSETLRDYERKLATVKVGPRDAWRSTESIIGGQDSTRGPNIGLFMRSDRQKEFGIATAWTVDFDIFVDGSTGKVIADRRSIEDPGKNATPAPSPTTTP